jgi:hypothetical protein
MTSAKEKFIEIYNKLPPSSKIGLVLDYTIDMPLTLVVCHDEVINDTPLGKSILKSLGFEDDIC